METHEMLRFRQEWQKRGLQDPKYSYPIWGEKAYVSSSHTADNHYLILFAQRWYDTGWAYNRNNTQKKVN
jgi:hypothetical protein